MKALAAMIFLACACCLRAGEPVAVPNTISPDGRFAIRLTHDRAEETGPAFDDYPDVQIMAVASNKILATFDFAADRRAGPAAAVPLCCIEAERRQY